MLMIRLKCTFNDNHQGKTSLTSAVFFFFRPLCQLTGTLPDGIIPNSGFERNDGVITMKNEFACFSPALCLLTVALASSVLMAASAVSLAQDEQPQPTEGPKPNVGETVIAPKKTTPPPQPIKKTEKINPSEVYTLTTSTDLVNLDVMVTDKNGDPISTLGKKNFKLLDDGVPQTISNFATTEAPLTVAMLVEFSSKWWGFLYVALEEAYQFINAMQPKDWVGVIDFDMHTHILQDFTQDRTEVEGALNTLRIPGFAEINFYDALAFTIDRMKDIQGRKAIIAVVTGCDTFSKLNYDQMLKIAKASETPIYPISILEFLAVRYGDNIPCGPGSGGFGMSLNTLQARNALTTIGKYSGGQAYFPRFEQDMPGIYQQINGQLRKQYSLGFMPTNPSRDGKYHKLNVQLVDDEGNALRIVNQKGKEVKYKIIAREGYHAPKS
jgi:VWFA-related protein